MLDDVAPDGMACMTGDFDAELEWLFAQPDPTVSERAGVQLMTIHKAKGLGFDVVIVPGLDRRSKADEPVCLQLSRRGYIMGPHFLPQLHRERAHLRARLYFHSREKY